jgi:hypothetical protein
VGEKDSTSLFLYVPKSTAKTAEFLLVNEDGYEIYKKELPMPKTSGILKVSLPDNVPLKVSKNYQWYFTIACDPNDWNRNEFVKGSIQRVGLDSSAQNFLKKIDPLKKAKFYADNNFWYNTLETIAELRKQKPSEWKELLTSVGLQDLVDVPLLNEAKP